MISTTIIAYSLLENGQQPVNYPMMEEYDTRFKYHEAKVAKFDVADCNAVTFYREAVSELNVGSQCK